MYQVLTLLFSAQHSCFMSLFFRCAWRPFFFSRHVTAVVIWLTSAIGLAAPSLNHQPWHNQTQTQSARLSPVWLSISSNPRKCSAIFLSLLTDLRSELINMKQVWGWFYNYSMLLLSFLCHHFNKLLKKLWIKSKICFSALLTQLFNLSSWKCPEVINHFWNLGEVIILRWP